jgi:formylglycine-generating enzyme required for sulfatase activity
MLIDAGLHPLVNGSAPPWASAWGEDRFGVWASVTIGDVTQRLRWIPSGRFLMGSPEDEEGRREVEGPRHAVVLSAGYWLFDTPCTQALWEAVMGENPSRFRSPTRPVERVSFADVGEFLERVNRLVPGLELVLPSEAEWEYACRAGTETATYAGPMTILGEANAPVLDTIAWYRGNSGVGFELTDGEDSSGWAEKQHAHDRAGTRPVGLKAPNAWGLFDMLGNVWEWCADDWHDSYKGAPADGTPWLDPRADAAANRVVRGGSWGGDARYARSAYRLDAFVPIDRSGGLGFRCARVQGASGERRAERSKPSARSAPAAQPRPERRGWASKLIQRITGR